MRNSRISSRENMKRGNAYANRTVSSVLHGTDIGGARRAAQNDLSSASEAINLQLLSICVCGVAILMAWGLLLAGLLYVVADYSAIAWLFTTVGLALAHIVFATVCWRFAMSEDEGQTSMPQLGEREIAPQRSFDL